MVVVGDMEGEGIVEGGNIETDLYIQVSINEAGKGTYLSNTTSVLAAAWDL